MVIIIIVIVLGMLIGMVAEMDGYGEPIFGGIVGAVFGAIFGFMFSLLVGAIVFQAQPLPTERHTLQNLVDNTTTEGSFYLFSGSIEGVPQYSWYEETKSNTYERFDVDAELGKVHLIPKDHRAYYVKHTKGYPQPFMGTWAINPNPHDSAVARYDFYVPHGSITHEYKLDTK